jgi:DNA-binding NarL/FixJ family response regulator
LLNRRRDNDPLAELTERERQVLGLMAEGRSNVAITRQLRVSAKTVETHVANIFTKLDLLPTADDHRRVLAVVTYLRVAAAATA